MRLGNRNGGVVIGMARRRKCAVRVILTQRFGSCVHHTWRGLRPHRALAVAVRAPRQALEPAGVYLTLQGWLAVDDVRLGVAIVELFGPSQGLGMLVDGRGVGAGGGIHMNGDLLMRVLRDIPWGAMAGVVHLRHGASMGRRCVLVGCLSMSAVVSLQGGALRRGLGKGLRSQWLRRQHGTVARRRLQVDLLKPLRPFVIRRHLLWVTVRGSHHLTGGCLGVLLWSSLRRWRIEIPRPSDDMRGARWRG